MDKTPVPAPLWDSIRSELQRMLVEEPQISTSREGIVLLAEQLFELWQSLQKPDPTHLVSTRGQLRYEATVLAALSLRFLLDLNTMKG